VSHRHRHRSRRVAMNTIPPETGILREQLLELLDGLGARMPFE
jgi:hypothetical protein